MDTLTAFDFVVLILVALAAVGGLARGFVGEVFSLSAWIAGIAAVRFFHAQAKALFLPYVTSEASAAILGFVALFILAFLAVRIIGGGISRGTKASMVGPIDRLLGLGFGAAKGVLAASLLFLLANMTFDTLDPGLPPPVWLGKARTAPTLAMVSKAMVDFVEERRRIAPDSAALEPDRKARADQDRRPGAGYDKAQRKALDGLLDAQDERKSGTAI